VKEGGMEGGRGGWVSRSLMPWGWVALVLGEIVLRVLVVLGQLKRREGGRAGGFSDCKQWLEEEEEAAHTYGTYKFHRGCPSMTKSVSTRDQAKKDR